MDMKQSNRLYRLACLLSALCFCAVGCSKRQPMVNPSTPTPAPLPPEANYILHSNAPYHAVTVPFRLQDGNIMVTAEIDGKRIRCSVDTGSETILWPQRFNLSGKKTRYSSSANDATGHQAKLQEVILPSLKLGDFEVLAIPSYEWTSVLKSQNSYKGSAATSPLLGNSVFLHDVLTIDYRNHQIIIRDGQYDASRQKLFRGSHRQGFSRVSSNLEGPGHLGVVCKMGDEPLLMELDTGWGGDVIALPSKALKPAELSSGARLKRAHFITAFGTGTADYLDHTKLVLSQPDATKDTPITVISPAIFVASPTPGADGIIGTSVLSRFRLTIDYPRQKVYFEPYPVSH